MISAVTSAGTTTSAMVEAVEEQASRRVLLPVMSKFSEEVSTEAK